MSDTSSNNDNNDSTYVANNRLNFNNYEINYQQISENINLCKKVIANYKKWYEDLSYVVYHYLENLENYCKNLEDLINKKNNDLEWEMNFPSFQNNNININNLETIYNEIIKNEGNKNFKKLSLKFLENLENNNCLSLNNDNSNKYIKKKIEKMP